MFLKKKKAKNASMLVSDIKIFLKKKKKRSANMVMTNVRIFKRMSLEIRFLKCRR